MTTSQLYFLLKLDDIRDILGSFGSGGMIFGLIVLVCAIVVSTVFCDEDDDDEVKVRKTAKAFIRPSAIAVIAATLMLFLRVGLPSTKQMAAIYVVPAIANSQAVCEIPSRIVGLANEWLEELRPMKEKVLPKKK